MTTSGGGNDGRWTLLGAITLVFSFLYLVSDVLELNHGGFSTAQLALTYAAEAAIPFFVLGLYLVQRPRIGRSGLIGALAYAYAFVFFTSTVVYALVDHTSDWNALTDRFGAWITIHSVIMVVAGIMFGVATMRAGVLPRWTGATLILGMILMTASAALPDGAQTAAAGVRDLAFAGMGGSLLVSPRARRLSLPWRHVETA
jgi:surface polysaccharide O-acyltransferase-like enzyme